jgi:hypothetical protein
MIQIEEYMGLDGDSQKKTPPKKKPQPLQNDINSKGIKTSTKAKRNKNK